VLEPGIVLIQDNRIAAVGAAGQLEIPADAQRIDLAGRTVLPGLIDIHAHGSQGVDDLIPQQNWLAIAHLALGVTTTHDPSNRASEIFAAAEYQRAGVITAPRLFSTGEIIYGARSESFAHIENLEDAREHVRRLAAQGAIAVKNYNQPRRDQRQMVVTAAREAGLMVVAEGASLYHMDMNLIADGNTGIEHNVPPETFYADMLQFWPETRATRRPWWSPTAACAARTGSIRTKMSGATACCHASCRPTCWSRGPCAGSSRHGPTTSPSSTPPTMPAS
jgi:imidazolonepropionase-like amidohydrolase